MFAREPSLPPEPQMEIHRAALAAVQQGGSLGRMVTVLSLLLSLPALVQAGVLEHNGCWVHANDGDCHLGTSAADTVRCDDCYDCGTCPEEMAPYVQLLGAAERGNAAEIEELGVRPGLWSPDDGSPLSLAARMGHVAVIDVLIERSASLDAQDSAGQVAVTLAALQGHEAVLTRLLQAGASISAWDRFERPPLHRAAEEDNAEAVQMLLSHGADVDGRASDDRTALHWAIYRGTRALRVLLEHSANVHIANRWGHPPLHEAAAKCNVLAAELLLQSGASINVGDEQNKAALHWAVYSGDLSMVDLLLRNGATLHQSWDEAMSPLHLAALGFPGAPVKSTDVAELLLQNRNEDEVTDILLARTDHSRRTAYDVAKFMQDIELANYLAGRGGKPQIWGELLHALRDTRAVVFTIAGILFGIGVACLDLWSKTRHEEKPHLVPEGAWLLAAGSELDHGCLGAAGPVLAKLLFMAEVCMNVVFVFGQCSYAMDHDHSVLGSTDMAFIWIILWALPAMLHFGFKKVLANPVMAASVGHSPWLRLLSTARFAALFICIFVDPFEGVEYPVSGGLFYKAWKQTVKDQFDESGSLNLVLFSVTGIDTQRWYSFFVTFLLLVCCSSAFLVYLRPCLQIVNLDKVRLLAQRVHEADSADLLRESVGVTPIVWYPTSVTTWGLLVYLGFLLLDIGLDIWVALELLARQHYVFYFCSLAIFVSSIIPELGGLYHLPRECRATLKQGYMSDRLLSLTQRELGWEAFLQLALQSYSLVFLAIEPGPFLITMASMFLSCWNLSSHLYNMIELADRGWNVRPKEKEDVFDEDGNIIWAVEEPLGNESRESTPASMSMSCWHLRSHIGSVFERTQNGWSVKHKESPGPRRHVALQKEADASHQPEGSTGGICEEDGKTIWTLEPLGSC